MQPSDGAVRVAETLLAVTLSAAASVDAGDWQTAGQLLRRREQLLTKLENCPDLQQAVAAITRVQEAERVLTEKMEAATREAMDGMNRARDVRAARRVYSQQAPSKRIIERAG